MMAICCIQNYLLLMLVVLLFQLLTSSKWGKICTSIEKAHKGQPHVLGWSMVRRSTADF